MDYVNQLKNNNIKSKFTLLPPRHILPIELLTLENVLIKEKSDGIDVENDDESEISCEVLFGKFYYDLNNTIFKKICLEEEFDF